MQRMLPAWHSNLRKGFEEVLTLHGLEVRNKTKCTVFENVSEFVRRSNLG